VAGNCLEEEKRLKVSRVVLSLIHRKWIYRFKEAEIGCK
jgi:hypothetical protein